MLRSSAALNTGHYMVTRFHQSCEALNWCVGSCCRSLVAPSSARSICVSMLWSLVPWWRLWQSSTNPLASMTMLLGREENLTSLRADIWCCRFLNDCSSLKRFCLNMIYNLWVVVSALKFPMNTCFLLLRFYEHIQIGGSHPRWPSHCWDSQLQMRGILAKLERQQNWSNA